MQKPASKGNQTNPDWVPKKTCSFTPDWRVALLRQWTLLEENECPVHCPSGTYSDHLCIRSFIHISYWLCVSPVSYIKYVCLTCYPITYIFTSRTYFPCTICESHCVCVAESWTQVAYMQNKWIVLPALFSSSYYVVNIQLCISIGDKVAWTIDTI